jgi:hypothetical protein
LALAKDAPEPRAIMRRGQIIVIPQVGEFDGRNSRARLLHKTDRHLKAIQFVRNFSPAKSAVKSSPSAYFHVLGQSSATCK